MGPQYQLAMRRLAKAGIAHALQRTGADALLDALAGARGLPVVLGYHNVVEDAGAYAGGALPGMMISRRMLAQHLDWLGRRFRFVSLDELGERLLSGNGGGRPLAAVTFDDGYRDVYAHAFPLLREKGIPAAVFVVTDLMGTTDIPLYDRLYLLLAGAAAANRPVTRDLRGLFLGLGLPVPQIAPLDGGGWDPVAVTRFLLGTFPQDQLRQAVDALGAHVEIDERALLARLPLTWEMAAEMSRAGITIGSHTRTHPVLTLESQQKVLAEVAGSRRVLEHTLGIPVRHFAYPGGGYNRDTVRAVAAAGYRFAYTTCRHRDAEHPLLTVPRTLLWETSSVDVRGRFSAAVMSCQVRGMFTPRCRGPHGAAGGGLPRAGAVHP